VEERAVETTTAKFDLTVVVDATSDGLRVLFEYNRDLFDAATVERVAAHYQALLESAAHAPSTRLSGLRLMDEQERRALARGPFDDPPEGGHYVPQSGRLVPDPSDRTPEDGNDVPPVGVHRDFESLAARQPDALALIGEGERV